MDTIQITITRRDALELTSLLRHHESQCRHNTKVLHLDQFRPRYEADIALCSRLLGAISEATGAQS